MTVNQRWIASAIVIITGYLGTYGLPENMPNHEKEKKERKKIVHIHEEVVVTATMVPKAVRDCSASINLVVAEDLRSISASNALNILNYLPGIFVKRTGDFGRADVDIRGLGQRGRRIAILVDGRPEKMGLFGCVVSHAFPLDNVERIEVVKGPSSVLYGSEAFGGVINILTRKARDRFETDLIASLGSYNTQQLTLRHGGNLKQFNYYLTLDRRKSDGHIEHTGYSGLACTGKVIYEWSKHFQVSLQGKYFDGKKYEAGPVDFPLSDSWNDYKRGAVDLSVHASWREDELFIKTYRDFGHHVFSDGWDSKDYVNGGVVRYTTHRIPNNELTLGADFRVLGGESFNFPQGSWNKSEGAVFLQDEYILGSRWVISAGLRLQLDSMVGREFCPHLGLVFQANDRTLFRGALNKGFRSPQLNELYMYPAANPDLKPERVWNIEVGFERRISPQITAKGVIFHMKGSNLVETIPHQTPPPQFIFMNSGEFSFYGAEVGCMLTFDRTVSGHLFYTYLDPGENTRGRPGQKVDLSLRFTGKSLNVAFHGQYVADYFAENQSQKPLPSYLLVNGRLILAVSKKVELFLDINNIFNKAYLVYVDLPGQAAGAYKMPGRNINLGIRIKQ